MARKYTLLEAMDKGLLLEGETVDITRIYKPYKNVYYREADPKLGSFYTLSLEEIFRYDEIKGTISRNSKGEIYVTIEGRFILESEEKCKFFASKLLTLENFGIKAEFTQIAPDRRKVTINLGPDITVRFEGEEETPVLELPEHIAYTF